MDLHTARVIYDGKGYELGVSYTRDPYQQARDAYHEAERVLRDAGELWDALQHLLLTSLLRD